VLKRLEGLEAELYKLQLKKDHAYFKLKHPSFDV
jgi:hypothetical protein